MIQCENRLELNKLRVPINGLAVKLKYRLSNNNRSS